MNIHCGNWLWYFPRQPCWMHSNLVFIRVRAGLLIDVHVQGLNKPRSSNWPQPSCQGFSNNPRHDENYTYFAWWQLPFGTPNSKPENYDDTSHTLLRRFRLLNLLVPRLNMTCKHDQTYTHDTETVNFLSKASCARGEMWSLHERRLLLIIFWKAACVSVTPYLVQLTFSLEACSWKNGDLVFQCLSFFSIVWWVRRRSDRWPLCQETSLAKKMKRHLKNDKKRTSWRDGHQEAVCVEVLDLVLTSVQTSFFSAPTVSKVQITDMLLLSTSFFSYPLPRSHRQGGFEKKNVSIHKLFLSFPNKGGCSHVRTQCNKCIQRSYPKMSLSILVLQMHNPKINKTRKNKDLKWFTIDFWKDSL